jgi:hypothetical protein
MGKVVFVHAHGEGKSVRSVEVKDGKVSKNAVKTAIDELFNGYSKKVRENQTAKTKRDGLKRWVDNAGKISGAGMGQNTHSTNAFDNDDMSSYHMDIEFDSEVTFS